LWPPPWWRVVIRPWLLRPPCFFSGSVRLFSGLVFVTSSNVETLMKRRPGLVGLYFFSAMASGSPGDGFASLACEAQAVQGRRERAGW
jgi:hypothetical protein